MDWDGDERGEDFGDPRHDLRDALLGDRGQGDDGLAAAVVAQSGAADEIHLTAEARKETSANDRGEKEKGRAHFPAESETTCPVKSTSTAELIAVT